jgi:hypothetical protein
MSELYPDVPKLWAEWVYDLCKNEETHKIKEIMEKVEQIPSRFVAEPGESHTMEIIDSKDSLTLKNENNEKKE